MAFNVMEPAECRLSNAIVQSTMHAVTQLAVCRRLSLLAAGPAEDLLGGGQLAPECDWG